MSARRGGAPVGTLEPVASLVQRLAVLLAAGVPPASAWGYLAEGSGSVRPRAVVAALNRGTTVADAILGTLAGDPAVAAPAGRRRRAREGLLDHDHPEATAWRGLAAAWFVATDVGAPLASTLRNFAASLRDLAQLQRELATALAGPAATARMVTALPLVGVLFGALLGFDTLGTLFTTGPGLVCLGLGGALMLAARSWNRKLMAGAAPTRLTPGLTLDLTAIAVSGGSSIPRATSLVADSVAHCGVGDDDAAAAADDVLELSRRAGVPAAALLRSAAEEARRDARAAGERRAATVAVQLMLPLGLCILPAFMLLGVAPLLIAVVASTVGNL